MKITQIDRSACKLLKSELESTLRDLSQKFGVSGEIGRCTYGSNRATFKVTVIAAGAVSKTLDALRKVAKYTDLDLGKVVIYDGAGYKLVGFKGNAPKYPYILKNLVNGGEYVFPRDFVEREFKNDPDKLGKLQSEMSDILNADYAENH